MIELIQRKRTDIAAICRKFGVCSLDVFGSAANGTFDESTSDVDFIVDFADRSPGIANRYLDFAEALEHLLGRQVDVMFSGPITNPYLRQTVNASRENIFEDRSRQAPV